MSLHPVTHAGTARRPRLPAPPSLRLAAPPRRPHHVAHAGTVARPRLVRPLLDDLRAVAAIVAPAGYGKTTLLAQWSDADPRPFAWARLTEADDDPRCLAQTIASALGDLRPVPGRSAPAGGLERTLAGLRPAVLVLDDLHVLRSPEALAVVAGLASSVPPGVTLAVASRRDPALPLGLLRSQDEVVEVRTAALAMSRTETRKILRTAGLTLTTGDADRLHELTQGWPAALRLAARAIREQDDGGAALEAFGGDDSTVVDFVREEVLAALADEDRDFLLRASILDPLHGPVCDALVDRHDSAARLRRLARGDIPLSPLDRSDTAFRLHPIFADALRSELRCADGRLEAELHRRASEWYERDGDDDRALEHAVAGADPDRAAALLADRAPALVGAGRVDDLENWLGRLGDADVAARPALALAAALVRLTRGDRDGAERWADVAEEHCLSGAPRMQAALDAGLPVVRAAIGRGGAASMVSDAARASAAVSGSNPWHPFARLLEGAGHCVAGRRDDARAALRDGARLAVLDAPLVRSLCLAQLAFVALEDGDPDDAAALAARARSALDSDGLRDAPAAALTFAMCALVGASRAQLDEARQDIGQAAACLSLLPDTPPWYGALSRVALARAELRLSDVGRARELLGDASRLSRRMADADGLRTWLDDAWAQMDDYAAGPVACPSVLTRAELRVLRLLPSHLSFREIAARLHVSANTVKTQAHAVYRKLDATSRSEAVANARTMGLVDG